MLSKIKSALLGSVLAFGLAGAVSAGETTPWRTVGDWSVLVDPSMSNGCYIWATYVNNIVVRVGIDARDRKSYLAIYADGLEVGKSYSVEYRFDDVSYSTTAVAYAGAKGRVFLASWNMSVDALADFAVRTTLKVIIDGNRTLAFVKLRGTYAAVDEMLECQKAQNAAQTSQVTPRSNKAADGGGSNSEAKQWNVPIVRNGSSIHLEATLNNGAPMTFMLDTGATTVNITEPMRLSMGLPIVRYATVTYGDGRKGQEPIVMLKRLAVGNVYLTDIEATVGGNVPLIGKNFLDAFSSYEINNAQAMLVLKK